MVNLIIFEGSDYVGKTTISKYLADRLARQNVRLNSGVIYPNKLSLMVCDYALNTDDLTKETLYTFAFLLDRQENEYRDDQSIIIQDRYWPSIVAYGRFLNKENSIHNNFDFRKMFLQPNAIVYLTCSVEEKIRRTLLRKKKSFLDEFFIKDNELSNRLEEEIIKAIKDLPNLIDINTTSKTIEETASIIERELIERGIIK
jgi:thymidylate kinase